MDLGFCEYCKIESFGEQLHHILCPKYSILDDRYEKVRQKKVLVKKHSFARKNVEIDRYAKISEFNWCSENVITSESSLNHSEMNATNTSLLRNKIRGSFKSGNRRKFSESEVVGLMPFVRGCLSEENRKKLDACVGFPPSGTSRDDCISIPGDSRVQLEVFGNCQVHLPLSILTTSPSGTRNNQQVSTTNRNADLKEIEDLDLYLNSSQVIPANIFSNKRDLDACVGVSPLETHRVDCILVPDDSRVQYKENFENSEEPLDLSIRTASPSVSRDNEQISTTNRFAGLEDFKEIDLYLNSSQINSANAPSEIFSDLLDLYQVDLNDFHNNDLKVEINQTHSSSGGILDVDKNAFINAETQLEQSHDGNLWLNHGLTILSRFDLTMPDFIEEENKKSDSGQECLDMHEYIPQLLKSTEDIKEPVTKGEFLLRNHGSRTGNENKEIISVATSRINTTQSSEYQVSQAVKSKENYVETSAMLHPPSQPVMDLKSLRFPCCYTCDKLFTSNSALRKHLQGVHRVNINVPLNLKSALEQKSNNGFCSANEGISYSDDVCKGLETQFNMTPTAQSSCSHLPEANPGFSDEKEMRKSDSRQKHLDMLGSVPREVKNTDDITESVIKEDLLVRNHGDRCSRSENTEVLAAGTSGIKTNQTPNYKLLSLLQRTNKSADSATKPYLPNQSILKFRKVWFHCVKCNKVYASIDKHRCSFVPSDYQSSYSHLPEIKLGFNEKENRKLDSAQDNMEIIESDPLKVKSTDDISEPVAKGDFLFKNYGSGTEISKVPAIGISRIKKNLFPDHELKAHCQSLETESASSEDKQRRISDSDRKFVGTLENIPRTFKSTGKSAESNFQNHNFGNQEKDFRLR